MNPDLDLTLQRIIRAPRQVVWNAWTEPSTLERWWTPAPTLTRGDLLDVRPGGGFVTRMSDNGHDCIPHTDATFSVRHGDPAARARHEELGFFDGCGSVTEALATLAEGETVR